MKMSQARISHSAIRMLITAADHGILSQERRRLPQPCHTLGSCSVLPTTAYRHHDTIIVNHAIRFCSFFLGDTMRTLEGARQILGSIVEGE